MEGSPHEAAKGIFDARERLYGAMMDLMGQGDLPAAYGAVREAQGFLETVRDELASLARVNGVGGELDALDGTEPEPARRDGFCSDNAPCINSCGSGPCSRVCRVCRRVDGTSLDSSVPCPSCMDYPVYAAMLAGRPPPDPERKPASSLLSNASLAGYRPIPEGDLRVELVPLVPGTVHIGIDRGVRVSHIPTGAAVVSSKERSQLRNKASALEVLTAFPRVQAYLGGARCTYGGDCPIHPDTGGLHDYDGQEAADLPVHRIPGDRRDPR